MLTASVVDQLDNPVPNWPVSFTTDRGTLSKVDAITGADGKAVTELSADAPSGGGARVSAIDQDGNNAFADVQFSTLKMIAKPVKTDVQGGVRAWAKVEVTFSDLKGNEVTWSPNDGDCTIGEAAVIDADGNAIRGIDRSAIETRTVSGKTVAYGVVYDVPADSGFPADGTRTVRFSNAEVYTYTGPFEQWQSTGGSAQADVTFTNTADAAATYNKASWSMKFAGSGFTPGSFDGDTVDLGYMVAGNRYDLGWALADPSGKLELMDNYAVLRYLPAGTYDLVVDGLVFPQGLTVVDQAPKAATSFSYLEMPYDARVDRPVTVESQLFIDEPYYGNGLAGKDVKLQKSSDRRTWTDVCSTTSDADGLCTFSFQPTEPAYYRTVFAGDDAFLASATNVQWMDCQTDVTFNMSIKSPAAGAVVRPGIVNVFVGADLDVDHVTVWVDDVRVVSNSTSMMIPVDVRPFGLGTHVIKVAGSDFAGNPAESSVSIVVKDATVANLVANASVIGYGKTAMLSGSLKDAASGALAKSVRLESSKDCRTWSNVSASALSAAADGTFSMSVSPVEKTWYRVVFDGDGEYLAASSAAIAVTPQVALTNPSLGTVVAGRRCYPSGYLKPGHQARTSSVQVQCYRAERGKYVLRQTAAASNSNYSSYTKYSAQAVLGSGKWAVRAYAPADAGHAASYSGWTYVTVK